ncbi:MAG TPA: hypothetical protein VF618_04095 [Thermoanaerobaculia bacterium]
MLRRKVLLFSVCALTAAQLATAAQPIAPALELARKLSPVMPLASTLLLANVERSIPTPIPQFEGSTVEVVVAKRTVKGQIVTACVDNQKDVQRVLAAKPETIAASKTAAEE